MLRFILKKKILLIIIIKKHNQIQYLVGDLGVISLRNSP